MEPLDGHNITGDGTDGSRIRALEIVVTRQVQQLKDQGDDIVEIKSDVKNVATGQRTLIFAVFTLAISFMGAAAAVLSVAH